MIDTFLMGKTRSIILQSLGKIVQRAPAVDTEIWCSSLRFFSVCHAPRPQRCSLEEDIVRTSIVWRSVGRFWCGFTGFSEWIGLSESVYDSHFLC